jgi:O-antigen/teichoic acid export membrane protein
MLIRQTLLYLPAQILGPLVQFIAAIVWTHFLSAHEYGDLMIILSVQDLVFLLCMSWWTHYTMRYLGEKTIDIPHFQAQENSIILIVSLFQALVAFCIVSLFIESISLHLIILTVILSISKCLLTHLAERARFRGRIFDYSMTQIISPILGVGLGFLLLLNFGGGTILALQGFVIAQIISLIIVWVRLDFGWSFAKPSVVLLQRALSYGLPLLFAGGLAWVSINGIRLIVEHVQSAEQVGLISVGWGLGQRVISVVAMLVTAASYPLALSHMNNGERHKSFEQVSLNGALLIGLILPTIIGVIFISPLLTKLTVGIVFQEATYVILPIAVLAAGVRNMRVHFLDQVFMLSEKPSHLLCVNIVEVVATILACYTGLLNFGLIGAALGCLAGTLTGAAICLIFALRQGLKMPISHLIKIGIASVVMAIMLYFTPIGSGYSALVFQISVGVFVYCFVHIILYWKVVLMLFRSLRMKIH